jgi:hypothetical protein
MAARKPRALASKPKAVNLRTQVAYHEAGHAVLSAAIANKPRHVSIRPEGTTLGRSGARASVYPTSRVQIDLAGLAAEHLLTGRRPRQLDQDVGFSLIARLDPALREAFVGAEDPRVQGTRGLFEAISREPRLDATAIQTVGSKGHDGFVLARVRSSHEAERQP